jgi:hypothetical protein
MAASMRKPNFGKPRSAVGASTLSSRLPRLKAPLSAATIPVARPRPVVGRPGAPAPAGGAGGRTGVVPKDACRRCGHVQNEHPVRYVCDKYPHPDPFQLCGCEVERVEDPCARCGHKARSHKARHRCKTPGCRCWGYDGDGGEAGGATPC